MIVLGLNFAHDGSACMVKDGKLLCAISSERVTRIKKFHGVTPEVINYLFEETGYGINDVDAIALSQYYLDRSNNTLKIYHEGKQIKDAIHAVFDNDYMKTEGLLFDKKIDTYIFSHHLCHCASSFYTSSFDKALCFSLDSSYGDIRSNSMYYFGNGKKLEVIECPGLMIGVAYTIFTQNLGLGPGYLKAGSTMGLAAYGKPLPVLTNKLEKYINNCFFERFSKIDYRVYFNDLWKEWSRREEKFDKSEINSKLSMDLAASIQLLFEESILKSIKNFDYKINNNLCLSGGSFLNCNINSRIINETNYKNVHHFPACGDDGIAIGAALYLSHHIFDQNRNNYSDREICYLGKKYDDIEVDYKYIAKLLSNNKIIGWFFGESEFGPRALGHRSILADPRNYHNRELLNFYIKNREWFRPFAPVVLEDECDKWFDLNIRSPFMLYTCNVKNPNKIPAVTHVDNSARVQTINENMNPQYFKLLTEFFKLTNVPVLINTSLNGNGEPILETEEEAIEYFNNSNLDAIVINGKIYEK